MSGNDHELTRVEATKFLSTEVVVGMVIQTFIFLAVAGFAWGNIRTEVDDIRDHQKSLAAPERLARIEEKVGNISATQAEFKAEIREIRKILQEMAQAEKQEQKRK